MAGLHGPVLVALTDWVPFANIESSNNLKLLVGDPYTDGLTVDLKLEWAALDDGARELAWTNGVDAVGGAYDIREVHGYHSVNDAIERMVPLDRSTRAIVAGSSGAWDDTLAKDADVLRDTTACYMVYHGAHGTTSGIALARSPDATCAGPWPKASWNPIVTEHPGGLEASALQFPVLVEDLGAPSSERYALLYSAQENVSPLKSRIFRRTCAGPPDTCKWSGATPIIAPDANDPTGCDRGYKAVEPIYEPSGTWWIIGTCQSNDGSLGNQSRITFASGPSLTALTKSNHYLVDSASSACNTTLTSPATNTRTLQVASTAGCVADQYVVLDADATQDNWNHGRILSVDSATQLTLYDRVPSVAGGGQLEGIGANNRTEALGVRTGPGANEWWIYGAPFSWFSGVSTANDFNETNALWHSTTGITGAYTRIEIDEPVSTHHNFGHLRSEENPSFIREMFDSAQPTWTPTTAITPTPTWAPPPTATATPTSPTPTSVPTSLHVSGAVLYYRGARPVAGVRIDAPGVTTDQLGQYTATSSPGAYVLVPTKGGDDAGAITAFDAAQTLRAVVGLRTLDGDEALACDVTGDGTVSALDATRILQRSVGLVPAFPVSQLCGSDWAFVPAPSPAPNQSVVPPLLGGTCRLGGIGFDPLATDAAGQDFKAILFGDCSGNWQPPPTPTPGAAP